MQDTPDRSEPPVPEGWEPMPFGGAYFRALGPIYGQRQPHGGIAVGLRVTEQHLNVQGMTHGGMLMTVADGALTVNVALARGTERRGAQVTVSLNADFLSGARLGDWLEARVEITRLGKRLAYASCNLWVGDRQVLRSAGVFALVDRPPPPLPPGATEPPLQDG